jgi:aspartyl protease family protein
MLGWALRRVLLIGAICAAWLYAWPHRQAIEAAFLPKPPVRAAAAVPSNLLRFTPDRSGHVFLTVDINGTPTPCMVDTGATYVALSPARAQAAGIAPASLRYNARVDTANGQALAAPVTLREVRIQQLSMADVPAFVGQTSMDFCLLGQSFLKRLDGFEMVDGVFVMRF